MIVKTQNLWLAGYWRAKGLPLLEANAVEDVEMVVFIFADDANREPALTTAFFADAPLQATLRGRRDLGRAMYLAKSAPSRRCSGEELAAMLDAPRARRPPRRRPAPGGPR